MALTPELTKFTTASPVLASYDYVDIANGFGVVNYYAIKGKNPDGDVWSLIGTTTYPSYPLYTQVSDTTIVFTFTSLPFNTPKNIKGVGFMSLSFVTESAGIYGVCKLQHWDGTQNRKIP